MATPLTPRNLALCADCEDCITGAKCRIFNRKKTISFKIAKSASADYWKGYYDAHREILLGKRREWQKNNKCKSWASDRFHALSEDKKPDYCSRCGGTGRIIAHHPDYTDPLTVEWLCNSCHLKEHRQEKDL